MSKKNQVQKTNNGKTAFVAHKAEFYSGPLPQPSTLAQYNEIVPGAADRILIQFEEQSKHRRSLENIAITSEIRRAYLGIICGFLIGLAALGSAVFLALNNKELAGGILGTGGIIGLVSVFIYGSKARERDLKQHN